MQYLRKLDRDDLFQQVVSLRGQIDVYLRASGSTFAHYTSHAVDHGDQLIRELSNLLFEDPSDLESLTTKLTATEVYFLVLACYLHDAGMVVTDGEKYDLLNSPEWTTFVEQQQSMADDFVALEKELRSTQLEPTSDQQVFVAGLKQRWLLADYFRRSHAERVRVAISGPLHVRERFLGDDPAAEATLTAICAGHGLARSELGRESHFPTRRDHFGEPVDVRLLAILLRIADLLDMRPDRACSQLRAAASPMPESSKPHWDQYKRIVGRVTSPSKIGLSANCETADEHRILADWCRWIVEELHEAPYLLSESARHAAWRPPSAALSGANQTIFIERAPNATYRPVEWRFTFDEGEVITRLVKDVHGGSLGYLRELLQNALDATRAHALLLARNGDRFANLLPQQQRASLGVDVLLHARDGMVERLDIVDQGLGMTEEIVQNYFLQIGRSWYRSDEFRSNFSFTPTSRFGVGFLSVFSVAKMVRVQTRWHANPPESAIRIGLPGPQSYLLLEDDVRARPGTTVEIDLEVPIGIETVARTVRELCVAVEFPVSIALAKDHDDEVQETFFGSEDGGLGAWKYGTAENEEFQVETMRISLDGDGAFGALDFLVVRTGGTEDWSLGGRGLEDSIQRVDPLAERPVLAPSWTAINGLRANSHRFFGLTQEIETERHEVDLRTVSAAAQRGLDRDSMPDVIPIIEPKLETELVHHLQSRGSDWRYRSGLMRRFSKLAPNWAERVECIPTVEGGVVSRKDVLNQDYLLFTRVLRDQYRWSADERLEYAKSASNGASLQLEFAPMGLTDDGLSAAGPRMIDRLMRSFTVERGWESSDRIVTLLLKLDGTKDAGSPGSQSPVFCPFPDGAALVSAYFEYGLKVFNSTHPLLQEIERVAGKDPSLAERVYDDLLYPAANIGRCAETLLAVAERDGSDALGGLAQQLRALHFTDAHQMIIRLAVT